MSLNQDNSLLSNLIFELKVMNIYVRMYKRWGIGLLIFCQNRRDLIFNTLIVLRCVEINKNKFG